MKKPLPLFPPALKKGDKIGVISPSAYYDPQIYQFGIQQLKERGFEVVVHPQTTMKNHQMAGTASQRAEAIHDYFKDKSINALFCVSGGNGAIHLLDLLDYDIIRATPKILIGFSDVTLLLNAIAARTGLVTFHGPSLASYERLGAQWVAQLFDTLMGVCNSVPLKSEKDIKGTLYGGNLSVMQALIGTPYAPDMAESILMLEDINDHYSRYDRMIGHMRNAGWFKNLSGVILGEFLNSLDNPARPFGMDLPEIMATNAPHTPLVTNAPFGHGERLCTLPIGANIVLKNNEISFKSLI